MVENEPASPIIPAEEHHYHSRVVRSDEVALKGQKNVCQNPLNKQSANTSPTYQTIYKIIETEASQPGRQEVFKFANMIGTTQYTHLVDSAEECSSSQQERVVETANSFVDLQVPNTGLGSVVWQMGGNITFHEREDRVKSDRASRCGEMLGSDRPNQSKSDQ